ncbi:MAG TPA: ornithine carbamoyltransferase [Phycisphaerae bacterium]|jgi:ornithine carbamoyltransferase|nr:ornithine carbamoyltransferase [Phycisphaerae bacterium]
MAQKMDFISLADTTPEMLRHILDTAKRFKKQFKETRRTDRVAEGKTLACIFEKPSLRTRVSFEVAIYDLGGTAIYISPGEIGLGVRESVADAARVLSGMVDGIMARVFEHSKLKELAAGASIPVINGLSDYSHPCQAMADLMTAEEHFGKLEGLTLAYVGDGNNVARSLMVACAKFGIKFRIASPPGYELEPELVNRIMGQCPTLDFSSAHDPKDAVQTADVIYTDTWVSMGQEAEKESRMPVFRPYQINSELLAAAPKTAVVMHCLPAYRGVEITDEVMDGPQSVIFQESENRLHFQRGLLAVVMCGQ